MVSRVKLLQVLDMGHLGGRVVGDAPRVLERAFAGRDFSRTDAID